MLGVILLLPLLPTAFAQSSNETQSLLWGTYRPNLYFGMRPRIPQSLMTGLMWFGAQDYQGFASIRHSCEQGDGLDGYTWTEHDLREGGVQVLKDSKNNIRITTEWIKVPGGDQGGSWAARIRGKPMDKAKPSRNSFIFYFGLEGLGGLELENEPSPNGLEGTVTLSGTTPDLGDFELRIVEGKKNKHITSGSHADSFARILGKTQYSGLPVPAGDIWKAKDMVYNRILQYASKTVEPFKENPQGPPDPAFVLTLPNELHPGSNFFAFQKQFDGAFTFDVFFDSASVKQKVDSSYLNAAVPAFKESFTRRFKETFPIPIGSPPGHLAFSKAISANLFGGIGYFHGQQIVDRGFKHDWDQEDDSDEDGPKTQPKPNAEGPYSLLTATPSRPFFPRGFYWDEGFHLLLIGAWDNDLSLEILRDWVNLIDEDGWVGREQILGEEARSKVPQEFQAQYPTYANPPTLTMAVTAFIARLRANEKGPSAEELGLNDQVPLASSTSAIPAESKRYLDDPELAISYLKSIYDPLRRHYDWFRNTQRGQIKQWSRKARSRTEGYRWRGRTKDHVLTSGMDDYPRGSPHQGELHLDLISWMGFFTRTMKDIASFLGEKDDEAFFIETEKAILDNIEDLHWNEAEKMYCDVSVDENDESIHVCHRGYLSLFPFVLQLLPADSPHLRDILELIRDPEHLWSKFGVRSLSASHPLFGQGENYWRGPIWIQMNYLILSALRNKYAMEEGPSQLLALNIYKQLRNNVIDNVFKEYERTGYVWEQYDAISGEGKRSHPFTGWTSLVTLIISEKYY